VDLINRWIFFDEDRNPNNYLVISNSKNRQFMVAIDYDKADMLSETMKITGLPGKFGWVRTEKTRFLTLLRPENFEGISIDEFEGRLRAFAAISREELAEMGRKVFLGFCDDPSAMAHRVAENIIRRREYVDTYFRSMFKTHMETKDSCQDSEYSAFGQSFLDMHKRKCVFLFFVLTTYISRLDLLW